MHIGHRIKKYRLLADLNQGDLAEKIGKTRALLSHIEKTGKVNYYTLQSIADALNINIEDLQDENLQKSNLIDIHLSNQNEIESLKREVELLKSIIEKQELIIRLLESGKK